MDIATYLREQKQRLADTSQIVRDYSVFDFNYVPDRPLMREESKRIIDAMLRFEASGIPSNLAIIGSRGSGKTLTLRYLQHSLKEQTGLQVLYANCRAHNTSFKILAHLTGVRARGASLTELYDRFCDMNRTKTVVVLDEVDLMSPKDRRREILYLLSRSSSPYMVVLLSNNPQVIQDLDAPTTSSLQPELIHFRNYDAKQLGQILDDRAERGLHEWDPGQVAKIAAMTARRTNSDARVAIKTLYYLVTESGRDVESHFNKAQQEIVVDMIANVSDASLMILWAASNCKVPHAKTVYKLYSQYSQARHDKPFSYVYFYSTLSYLQSIGLVALVSVKIGRTYTNRILLTFDPEILTPILKLRFER